MTELVLLTLGLVSIAFLAGFGLLFGMLVGRRLDALMEAGHGKAGLDSANGTSADPPETTTDVGPRGDDQEVRDE
jgi:hypothetical protein